MIDKTTIIEWILIILVFGMYFTMPTIIKNINDLDRRLNVFESLKIAYLVVTIALIGYIIWEFTAFDMERNFRLSRILLIVVSIIMYYFNIFVKSKRWFED